jgi:hypothetical protein
MMSFLLDQLKNNIVGVVNYINNDTLRNLWYIYVDYFDINSTHIDENYNIHSLTTFIYLISFIALPILVILFYCLDIVYTIYGIIKY